MAGEKSGGQGDGGNAVDGLTPPTMKYQGPADGGEKTQIGPTPGATPSNVKNNPSSPGSSASVTGRSATKTVASDVQVQDLSSERLLKDAPRKESNGRSCPALNGIPLLSKIGQGGMGAVYYGIHPRLESEVAVKVLPFHLAEQDPGMIRRFFREAQIAAQVRSPHLVNVMDVNEEAGLFFLVMEYVAGSTAGHLLKAVVEKGQVGLPELDALDIAIAATEGLHAAHAQGIIHRDLKPENIMVPYLAREEKIYDLKHAKLMDLGLARNEESNNQSLTGVQAAMGTPGYMAPEQALDAKTASKPSDVFGMGATIYALLTGRAPFRAEAVMKVLMATMHEPHEPVIKIRPDVSTMLSEIVDKCLDKKQENRYPDAQALNRALKNCRRLLGGHSADDGDAEGEGVDLAGLSSSGRSPGRSMAGGVAAPGSQATIVGPQSGTGAAPKGKGMVMVAAIVVLVLATVGGWMMFGKKDDPKTGPGPVTTNNGGSSSGGGNTGKPLPPDPPKVNLDPAKVKILKKSHAANISLAEAAATAGDIPSAETYLELAQTTSINYSDAETKKAEDGIVALITSAKARKEFEGKFASIDTLVKGRKLKEALESLREVSKNAVADEWVLTTLEAKQRTLTILNNTERRTTEFKDILKTAAALDDAKIDELALKNLQEALTKLPKESDVVLLQKEAAWLIPDKEEYDRLEKKLRGVVETRQKEEKYKLLLADAKDATDPEKKLGLLNKALEIFDRNDAKAMKLEVEQKLGKELAAKLAAAEQTRRKNEFDAALADAQKLQATDPEKALFLIDSVLPSFPDDQLGKKLKKDAEAAIKLKADRVKFDRDIKLADDFIASADFGRAEERIKDAKALFKDDPQIATIETKLGTAKTLVENKKKYEDMVKKLSGAVQTRMALAEIEPLFNDATKLAAQINESTTKLALAKRYIDQAKAEELARKGKEEQFKGLVANGDKLDETAKALKGEDQIAELERAQRSYNDALSAMPDNPGAAAVTEKVKTMKARIETAKADLKKAQELAKYQALITGLKNEMAVKINDGDKLVQTRPPEAMRLMREFRDQIKDKPELADELKKIDAKITEYQAIVTQRAEQDVAKSLETINKDFTATKSLPDALTELKALNGTYPGRKDIGDVLAAVQALQPVVDAIGRTASEYDNRIRNVKMKSDKGTAEKNAALAIVASLRTLQGKAIADLITGGLKDATIAGTVGNQQKTLMANFETAFKAFETAAKQEDKKPDPPKKQDPPPREAPPPKSKGSVGEQDPFAE